MCGARVRVRMRSGMTSDQPSFPTRAPAARDAVAAACVAADDAESFRGRDGRFNSRETGLISRNIAHDLPLVPATDAAAGWLDELGASAHLVAGDRAGPPRRGLPAGRPASTS